MTAGRALAAAIAHAHAIALQGHGKRFTSPHASSTSTSTSMQRLLATPGFIDHGIVHGLDKGDPELIYRFAGS
ncbi:MULTISPECIES: hypothetical protein [Stenotrophomonas maltophilia group]|uniref:hypothetical protein n=1 Tax=Stenotrophomonas maltophilia group TaxID=995085 RepID=UPI00351F63A7